MIYLAKLSDKEQIKMKRYGQVIKVDEKNKELYIDYHKKVPKEIKDLIHECNMRNYSIFIKDDLLFAYFEYVGNDFEADSELSN